MEVHLGLIGCGQWGRKYLRHLASPPGELAWVCDSDPHRQQEIRQSYPGVRVTGSSQELWEDGGLAGVVIATPPATHYSLARAALLAGKHVLVEKPLCLKSSQAAQLVHLARQQGRVLMVGHLMLFHPALQKLRQIVRAGEAGEIRYLFSLRTGLGVIRPDVNVIWDLMVHDLALVHFLLGEDPLSVNAQGACYLQPLQEDMVYLTLRFPGGVIAHLHASWLDPCKTRLFTVVGSRQRLTFDDLAPVGKLKCYQSRWSEEPLDSGGSWCPVPSYGDIHLPHVTGEEPLALQCRHFFQCLEEGLHPLSGPEEGWWVTRVAEAAQLSLRQGQPVPLPPLLSENPRPENSPAEQGGVGGD